MTREEFNRIEEKIKNLSEQSNADLIAMMDGLSTLFDKLKTDTINLTYILDDVESKYLTILSEYEHRVK